MDDNGFCISESVAIMEYLCDKYHNISKNLYPKEPKLRALVKQRLCFNLSFYYPSIQSYAIAPIFYDYERTEPGLKKLENALQILEAYLKQSNGNYVANTSTVSIADIALIASTISLEAINFDLTPYTMVMKWYTNFKVKNEQLWNIANAGMQELKEFAQNPPNMSHIQHPFHPIRRIASD